LNYLKEFLLFNIFLFHSCSWDFIIVLGLFNIFICVYINVYICFWIEINGHIWNWILEIYNCTLLEKVMPLCVSYCQPFSVSYFWNDIPIKYVKHVSSYISLQKLSCDLYMTFYCLSGASKNLFLPNLIWCFLILKPSLMFYNFLRENKWALELM
jgi:hypothetical protein